MKLKQHLGLIRFGAGYLWRLRRGRRSVEAHLAAPREIPTPMPTLVQLRVTNLCNLRCRMCGQWGETGVYRETTGGELERERIRELIGLKRMLSLREYERLLDEIAEFQPIVSLFGGEPFLYPEILPLIRAIKSRGLMATVITHGGFLEQHAAELVAAGIDAIAVSIDGHPELHDRIRGQAGSYAKLERGVRALEKERRSRGKGGPMLVGIFPLTELNVPEVSESLEIIRRLPLDAINVGLRWYVTPEAGEAYERTMQQDFGIVAKSWEGFSFSWPNGPQPARKAELKGLANALKRLRRWRILDFVRGRPWLAFIPNVAPQHVPEYLTQHGPTFGHDLCPVAWYFAQVQPDGEVVFCGDFPDYSIGNVRDDGFKPVWLGHRARVFREKLAREPLPICSRCCGSFVYGRWSRPGAGPNGQPGSA